MKSQGVGKGRTVAFGLPLTKQSSALMDAKGSATSHCFTLCNTPSSHPLLACNTPSSHARHIHYFLLLLLSLPAQLLSPSGEPLLPADSARSRLTPSRGEGRGLRGGGEGGSGSLSHHHRFRNGSLGAVVNSLSPRRRGGSLGEGGRGGSTEDGQRSQVFSFLEVNRSSTPRGLEDIYDPLQARSLAALSTSDHEGGDMEGEDRDRALSAASRTMGSDSRAPSPQRMSTKQQQRGGRNQPHQGQGLTQGQGQAQGEGSSSSGQHVISEAHYSFSHNLFHSFSLSYPFSHNFPLSLSLSLPLCHPFFLIPSFTPSNPLTLTHTHSHLI